MKSYNGAMRMWRLWKLYHIQVTQWDFFDHSSSWKLVDEIVILKSITAQFQKSLWLPGVNKSTYSGVRLFNSMNPGFYGWNDIKWAEIQEPKRVALAKEGAGLGGRAFYPEAPLARTLVTHREYFVLGTALFFGKMVRATKGIRASHAVPESFILPPGGEVYELLSQAYRMTPIDCEAVDCEVPTGVVPWVKPLDIDFWSDTLLNFLRKYPLVYSELFPGAQLAQARGW